MGLMLLIIFLLLALIGVPIAISLALTAVSYFFINHEVFYTLIIAPRLFGGINSFELLAIPLFILSGDLLFAGRVSKTLVDLANSIVGSLKGAMAIVTTLACMFFGAVSGSGPATAAAIGSVVAPEMEKAGYDRVFTASVICASGPLGVLIPPSILMVVYGVVTGTSIGALLLAGIGPGLVFGLALMLYEYYYSRKMGYGSTQKFNLRNVGKAVREAIWALMIPIIILGGIYSGAFTPTEAAVVAVVYALVVGMFVYKSITLKTLPEIFLRSGVTTATILFIVGAVACFGWVLTREQIPEHLTAAALSHVSSPLMFMLICNIILIFAGMIENGSACILLLAPLMFPIAVQYGIDPVYFGAIMVANLAVGMITPPVAVTLYVSSRICNVPMSKLIPAIMPFFFVLIAALAVLVLFPSITLTIPNLVFK